MEDEPKQDRKILSYAEALEMARVNVADWRQAQASALDSYLSDRTIEQPHPGILEDLRKVKHGEQELEDLIAVGNKYNLLPDFDLEAEALKVYCRKNNLELSS